MKKIVLFSLVWMGFIATAPLQASGLDAQTVTRDFDRATNLLLAQDRDRHRHRNEDRQYSVYYRRFRDLVWILEGFHVNRRDAERIARRLERRGYRTDIRERSMHRWDRHR